MLRINNIASVDGNSFFKFLANQFRIGDENRSLEWNIIEGLLQIINATLEMKNKDGVTVAKIDGDNGSAMFAKGNALFNENGDVNITGRFESNKDGNRIIIDPEERALFLKDKNGNDAGMLYFDSSDNGNYSASLILKGEAGGKFGDTTNIIQSGGIRTYSLSTGHRGYYGTGKLDVESETAGFHADCTGKDGKLEYLTENIPDSPDLLKKWQHYCGDDGIVRMVK